MNRKRDGRDSGMGSEGISKGVFEDIERFRQDGYVVLPGVIGPHELAALQDETQAQIEAGPDREPRSDFFVNDGRFFRIQFLTDKSLRNDSMLLAGAHPELLERVAAICGPDWASYGTAMVFKAEGGGPAVSLHRDTRLDTRGFDPAHDFFNVDVYLDAATPETGCLKVIPGSHRIDDVRDLVAQGFGAPGLVDVPMQPGDVLFHDSMLVHGSLPTGTGSPLRRVLYYSFQSAGWMMAEGVLPDFAVTRRWIAQQIKLGAHSVARRAEAYPEEESFGSEVPEGWAQDVAAVPLDLRPIEGTLPWEQDPERRATTTR